MDKSYSVSYLGITNGELGVLTRRHPLEPTPPKRPQSSHSARDTVTFSSRPSTGTGSRTSSRAGGVMSMTDSTGAGTSVKSKVVSLPRTRRPPTADSVRSDISSSGFSYDRAPSRNSTGAVPVTRKPTFSEVKAVLHKSQVSFLADESGEGGETSFAVDSDEEDLAMLEQENHHYPSPNPRLSSTNRMASPRRGSPRYQGDSDSASSEPLPQRLTSDVYAGDAEYRHTAAGTIAHKMPGRHFRNTSKPSSSKRNLPMKRLKKRAVHNPAEYSRHASLRGAKLKQKARPVPKTLAHVYLNDPVDAKKKREAKKFGLAGERAPAITFTQGVRAHPKGARPSSASGTGSNASNNALSYADSRRFLTDVLSGPEQRRRVRNAQQHALSSRPRISPRSGALTTIERGTGFIKTRREEGNGRTTPQRAASARASRRISSARSTRPSHDRDGRPLSYRRRRHDTESTVDGLEDVYEVPVANVRAQATQANSPRARPVSGRKELFIKYLMFKRISEANKKLTDALQHELGDEEGMASFNDGFDIDTVLSDDSGDSGPLGDHTDLGYTDMIGRPGYEYPLDVSYPLKPLPSGYPDDEDGQ